MRERQLRETKVLLRHRHRANAFTRRYEHRIGKHVQNWQQSGFALC